MKNSVQLSIGLAIVMFFTSFSSSVCGQIKKEDNSEKLEIVNITASSWETTENGGYNNYPPELAIDGNLAPISSFRAEGDGEWLQLDLGNVFIVDYVNIMFPDGQKYTFDLDINSEDNDQWEKILNHQESIDTDVFQRYDINKQSRYLKLSGFGNTNPEFPEWFLIIEVEVFGKHLKQ